MPGHVCLFHIGRSGSTVLAGLLANDGRFDWRGEIFETGVLQPFERSLRRAGRLPAHRDAAAEQACARQFRHLLPSDWRRILASMRRQAPLREGRITGIEVKFFHLALSGTPVREFVSLLPSLGFDRVVVLERRNYLRKVVSSLLLHEHRLIARRAGQGGRLRQVRVDVNHVPIDRNPQPLLAHFAEFDRCFGLLRQALAERPHLWLGYETHVERDPLAAYRQVCEFLSVEPRSLRPALQRVNPYGLAEMVTNFEEVVACLETTPYRWMLEQ